MNEVMNGLVLNPEQKTTLANAVKEGVNSLYRKQAETDLVKEIASKVKDEMAIPPSQFNKLIKAAYKNSFDKLNHETTEILDLAEELNLYSHGSD